MDDVFGTRVVFVVFFVVNVVVIAVAMVVVEVVFCVVIFATPSVVSVLVLVDAGVVPIVVLVPLEVVTIGTDGAKCTAETVPVPPEFKNNKKQVVSWFITRMKAADLDFTIILFTYVVRSATNHLTFAPCDAG